MENGGDALSNEFRQKNEDTNSHFLESLRPLTQWMSLIGLPIPNTWFKHFYRYLCWIWVLSIHLALNIHICLNLESVSSSYSPNASSSALNWNYVIDAINFLISTVSVHTFLFIITRSSKWKVLIEAFDKSISPQLYFKCRRAALIAISCTILAVIFC